MEEFNKKLLGIYGTLFFFVSLIVFYILVRAYILFSFTDVDDTSFNIFYIVALLMLMSYIGFIGAVIYSILKGKKEDLRLQSALDYAKWKLD